MKTIAVISAGGVLGAAARYGLSAAWPTPAGTFPWSIFLVNVSGCLLIGVLIGFRPPLRVRLFLGTGLLGGYTTFSAYVLDFQRLVTAGRTGLALAYLGGTVVAALSAVYIGDWVARAVLDR